MLGRNEGARGEREGHGLKERKVGGNRRSIRGERERGGDIFSPFSCSHF